MDFPKVQLLPKFICRDILMGPYLAFLSLHGGHGYDFFPRTGQANFELGDEITCNVLQGREWVTSFNTFLYAPGRDI